MTWNPMGQKFDPEPVTLARFLLARIAEDEVLARRAIAPAQPAEWDAARAHIETGMRPDTAVHVARHDPTRVLAECEAKRRIVGLWNLQLSIPEPEYGLAGGEPLGGQGAEVYYDALKALALPYADHPDWREEWRPPVS